MVIGHKPILVPETADMGTNRGIFRAWQPTPDRTTSLLRSTIQHSTQARRLNLQAGGHRFDPGWLHHLAKGRTAPAPDEGAGALASQGRADRVGRLIEALVTSRR
jgi:hypothetical protein